jgi:hypothetical protein
LAVAATPALVRLLALRDGLLWGTGVVKIIRRGGDVDIERVPRPDRRAA